MYATKPDACYLLPFFLFVIPEGNLRLEPPAQPAIQLRNLWGTQKLLDLDADAFTGEAPSYNKVVPVTSLGLPFAERIHRADYATWPSLTTLCPASFSGIKTARDPFLVDIDKEKLLNRITDYYDEQNSDEEIARRYPLIMKDVPRYDSRSVRRDLLRVRRFSVAHPKGHPSRLQGEELAKHFNINSLVPYCYRPFDVRWLHYESSTKLLDERREEYGEAFRGELSIVSAQANRRGYDPPVVTRSLASYHVIERASLVIPLRFCVITAPGLAEERLNIDVKFLQNDQTRNQARSEEVFFHAIAVMHTPRYGTENEGALLNDWPRIPIPKAIGLLSRSAELGQELASLLDPESGLSLQAEWSFLAKLSIAAEFPESTPDRDQRNAARFALTAGWGGAGQGGAVMPRRGKSPERDWTPTELERLTTLATSQSLTLDDTLTLLGSRCVDVYLNDASQWLAVPCNVWDYTLGGYQVLKKWLSYRELPLLGRPLHEDEARYFAQVVRRITAILLMGPALDASYAASLPKATGLRTP